MHATEYEEAGERSGAMMSVAVLAEKWAQLENHMTTLLLLGGTNK